MQMLASAVCSYLISTLYPNLYNSEVPVTLDVIFHSICRGPFLLEHQLELRQPRAPLLDGAQVPLLPPFGRGPVQRAGPLAEAISASRNDGTGMLSRVGMGELHPNMNGELGSSQQVISGHSARGHDLREGRAECLAQPSALSMTDRSVPATWVSSGFR